MPSSIWAGPVPNLNVSSVAPAASLTLTDISPAEIIVGAGTPYALNLGTRIRLFACGEYTGTSTTSTLLLGFYMQQPGLAITAAGAVVLGITPTTPVTVSATAWPWQLRWEGRVTALSGPADSLTGQVNGQGIFHWSGSAGGSVSAWATGYPAPFPATLAARTVTQNAVAGGLNTNGLNKVMLGSTWGTTVTGVTTFTVDELTCELYG